MPNGQKMCKEWMWVNGYEQWVNARDYYWVWLELYGSKAREALNGRAQSCDSSGSFCCVTHINTRWVGVERVEALLPQSSNNLTVSWLLQNYWSWNTKKMVLLDCYIPLIPLIMFSESNWWSFIPMYFILFDHQRWRTNGLHIKTPVSRVSKSKWCVHIPKPWRTFKTKQTSW